MDDLKEIKLSEINWNKLSSNDYQAVNRYINEKTKVKSKVNKTVSGSSNKLVFVSIEGTQYHISEKLYNRLNLLTSEKSKRNLIDEIKETHQPYNETDILKL